MPRSLDHIVIYVRDLQQGIADYQKLGFNVFPGGDHPGGVTHNALVVFDDGAYLELISFKKADEGFKWWHKAQTGEGLLDYALLPGDIEQDVAAARKLGLALEGPIPGGRLRPDGVEVAWQTARGATADLPFLCGDVTPRALRVPEGEVRTQPNGVIGVAGITIAVVDLDASVQRYQALLANAGPEDALTVKPSTIPSLGIRTATFTLGSSVIALTHALNPDASEQAAALAQFVEHRGEGPFSVSFLVPQGSEAGELDPALTHGALLKVVVADRLQPK